MHNGKGATNLRYRRNLSFRHLVPIDILFHDAALVFGRSRPRTVRPSAPVL